MGSKYFGALVTTTVGMDQWYKREESNPWRPIASQIMSEIMTPPWSRDEISKPPVKKVSAFHFSRLRRQADVDAERKKKKREWMLKAHRMATGEGEEDHPRAELKDLSDGNYYEAKNGYNQRKDRDQYSNGNHHNSADQLNQDDRRSRADKAEDKGYSDRNDYQGDVKGDTKRLTPDRKHGIEPVEAKSHKHYESDGKNMTSEENEYYYYNNPDRSSYANQQPEVVADDSDLLKWR